MPLHWACSGGRDDIVDLLLNQIEVPLNEQDDVRILLELKKSCVIRNYLFGSICCKIHFDK